MFPSAPSAFPIYSKCALARRPSIQMRVVCVQMCSRTTLVDRNAFPMCSNALSLGARQSKCVSYMPNGGLARHPSTQRRLQGAQMCSRSALADLNVFSVCLDVLHVDTPKIMLHVLRIDSFGFLFCPGLDQAIFEPRHTFPKLWQIRSVLLCFDICFVQMFPWSGAAKLTVELSLI